MKSLVLIIHLEKSLQVLFRSPIVFCLLLHFGYHVASFDMIPPNPEKPWVDLSSIAEFAQSSWHLATALMRH